MSDEEELMNAMRAAAEKRGHPFGNPANSDPSQAAPAANTPEPLPIDWSTEPTPAAANGAQVLHTAQQFAILFTDMASFPGRNAADGQVGHERARIAASLRMDPSTYFQVLAMMASNWNKYVEANVPKQMRQPRFKLIDAGDLQLHGFDAPKQD